MPATAIHVTPTAGLDGPALVRIGLSAVAVGVLLSFVGAFGLADDPPVLRTVFIMAASLAGAAIDLAAYHLVLRAGWARDSVPGRVALAAALSALPMGLLMWGSAASFGAGPGVVAVPIFMLNAFVVGGAFIAVFVAPAMDAAVRRSDAEPLAPATEGASAEFVDRLPTRLRGGDLWALEAEDHYVRVHTSHGDALIRLRMADALRELRRIEGAQTHRSWWVVRAAVRDVERSDGRIALVLPNGRKAAVSRALAPRLRAAGWF